VLTFTAGGSGNSAFFRLNGFNETVRGIQTTVGQSSVVENNGPAGSLSTLVVNTAGESFTYDGIIRNASTGTSVFALTKAGPGTLTLASTGAVANNSHTGPTSIDDGKLVLENLAGYASPIVVNSTAADALTVNQLTRELRINAPISGAGGITKNGPFTFTLGGANSMTGMITLNDGILGLANDSAVGNATLVLNGGNIRAADAGRSLNNIVIVNGSFTLGRLTNLNGSITLNANATITGDNPDGPANGNSALGPMSGNFRVSFAEGPQGLGTGALVINAANSNAGGTALLSGRVNVSGTGSLANAPLVVDGGELNFGNSTQAVTSLSGAGGFINLGTGHTLTVAQALDTAYGGTIAGTGGLAKAGIGALTLTGLSFFSGPTTVADGALIVNGTLTGNVTVMNNAALGGIGTVGNVTSVGGRIVPGTSPGTLTLNSLQLDETSIWQFELATAGVVGATVNDLIQVNGALTLDGTLQVIPLAGFSAGTYRLANYTGALTDSGMLLDPVFLQSFPGSSIDTSAPGEVNLVVAVPEPASAGLLLGGLAAVTALRRRRAW
jgi:autotransporter-associated beta strand protein